VTDPSLAGSGHAWTSMLVVRIYHNVRSPAYPRPDHISHTHRVHISQNDTDGTTDEADDGALRTLRTWGPFCGDMSARVYERLHYGQSAGPVGIITGGSAVCAATAQSSTPSSPRLSLNTDPIHISHVHTSPLPQVCLLLDAVQEAVLCPSARDLSPMHLAFTCRDAKLFCWCPADDDRTSPSLAPLPCAHHPWSSILLPLTCSPSLVLKSSFRVLTIPGPQASFRVLTIPGPQSSFRVLTIPVPYSPLLCRITKMVCVFLTHKNARFPLLPSELQITLNLSDMGGNLA
jgi:hypothetical protein